MPVYEPGVAWLRGAATLTNGSTTVTTDGVITLNEILEGDRLYAWDGDTILGPFEIVGGEGTELELRESFTGSTGSYPVAIDRNPITRTGAKTLRDVARILATIEDADVEAIGEIRDEAVQAKEAAENLYGDLTAVQQAKTEAEEAAGDARDDAILTAQLVGQAQTHADDAATSAAVATASAIPVVPQYVGTVNLLDPSKITADHWLNAGSLSPFEGIWTTDFMPVVPGGYVTTNKSQGSVTGSTRGWNFFDYEKNYISATPASVEANDPQLVPAGAYYARLSFRRPTTEGITIVQGDTLPPEHVPFGIPRAAEILKASARTAIAARPTQAVNLFDPHARLEGYALRRTGGLDNRNSYSVTDYMPVVPGGKVTIGLASVGITSTYGLCFYDENLELVPGAGVGGPFSDNQVVDVPLGAYYMRMTLHSSQAYTLAILPGEQTQGHITKHTLTTQADVFPWWGRKFAVLGDSISANANWMATVAEQLKASLELRAAKSGRRMEDALKTASDVDLVQEDFEEIDATLLFLGTNDGGTTLGTIDDSTTDATFYGYTKKAVETLITWNPTMTLVVATLLHRNNRDVSDRSQALRDVAHLYAVPVLDFQLISGINALTVSTFYYDSVHPNALGYSACLVPTTVGFFSSLRPRT